MAVRTIIIYAICTLVTSVVMRVTRLDTENLSMFSKAVSYTHLDVYKRQAGGNGKRRRRAMNFVWAFLVGGLICVVGQLRIDLTKLTPARILVLYVVCLLYTSRCG